MCVCVCVCAYAGFHTGFFFWGNVCGVKEAGAGSHQSSRRQLSGSHQSSRRQLSWSHQSSRRQLSGSHQSSRRQLSESHWCSIGGPVCLVSGLSLSSMFLNLI